MTPRRKRAAWIIGALIALALVTFFVVNAFRQNLVFFYTPTQVAAGEAPQGRAFRIGGMVVDKSLVRATDGVTIQFTVTDTDKTIPVQYRGILPDLFKEGKGVVAEGRWENGVFTASEVLAKHDENYMPPEAQDAVNKAHQKAAAKKEQQ
ncbi:MULTISPECIES: cytochrome c maturation protein CcmE [Deefgea]|uniref:Cytochrome c-type biogenesis protein CcmE n=1 Tax=Deefgea chitinilytica TaxID=570276 RepID=A0ABS2CC15_9NEIS|nr:MULTISPECIES: cytochrome c maturation protein CcmE [Deefgea]MBM5571695.1 cytochrome c maturation protein CcmE [Deefgea chitinilytica]MBM9888930.1 cytochrome c maturation protein CcmE [Deefgea sp. CFH1-16]